MNNKEITQVVILAGGLGKRLSNHSPQGLPKILANIGKISLLEDIMMQLSQSNLKKVLLLLGYKSDQVLKAIDTIIDCYDLEIEYIVEGKPLGTGGAILNAFDLGKLDENFLILHGDLIIRLDLDNFIERYKQTKCDLLMLVHPSNHMHDSDLVEVDQNMKVKKLHTKHRSTSVLIRNLCNAGVYAINSKILQRFEKDNFDLDRDIIPKLVDEGVSVYCERNKGFVRDMGTPERLLELIGKIEDTNFSDPRPALFIDRDGTINVQAEFITSWRQIRLHEDAVRLIKRCNQSRYWVFVITNQSVLARGLINIDQLKEIHSYIDLQLSENGAYVDDYFFCPHHPDSGYEGEVIDLKIKCDCRKPKSGLIEECIKQYSVDLKKSIVVGDSWRDKMLAENLELQFYIVNRNNLEQLPGTISTLDDIQIS